MLTPCAWIVSVVPSVLGVVLSGLAIAKINRGQQESWGMAVTGLVCSVIGLLAVRRLSRTCAGPAQSSAGSWVIRKP